MYSDLNESDYCSEWIVCHVTDLELDVSGALSQCPSGDPAQQVQSSIAIRTLCCNNERQYLTTPPLRDGFQTITFIQGFDLGSLVVTEN